MLQYVHVYAQTYPLLLFGAKVTRRKEREGRTARIDYKYLGDARDVPKQHEDLDDEDGSYEGTSPYVDAKGPLPVGRRLSVKRWTPEECAIIPMTDGGNGLVSAERYFMKTDTLLLCATKLIILARRVKERM